MDVATAVVSLLQAAPPVTSIISDRIAAVAMPAKLARPNVVYQVIDGRRFYGNDGPTGLKRATLQVSCYADTYGVAKSLAAAVSDVLDGYAGTAAGVAIQSCFVDDERDAPTPPPTGQERGVAGAVLVFLIAYSD